MLEYRILGLVRPESLFPPHGLKGYEQRIITKSCKVRLTERGPS